MPGKQAWAIVSPIKLCLRNKAKVPSMPAVIPTMLVPHTTKKSVEFCLCCGYIFLLLRTDLKDFPQHSKRPIVSSVLFPLLSFFPAIFQVFFGLLTSFLQLGHLAIAFTFQTVHLIKDKTFSIERGNSDYFAKKKEWLVGSNY